MEKPGFTRVERKNTGRLLVHDQWQQNERVYPLLCALLPDACKRAALYVVTDDKLPLLHHAMYQARRFNLTIERQR